MDSYGILPILAPRSFFGRPSDAPARPPVFSGIQYKLPTAAVAELPPFRSGADNLAGPMEQLKAAQPSVSQVFFHLVFWGFPMMSVTACYQGKNSL
jgi:hypothetical protein